MKKYQNISKCVKILYVIWKTIDKKNLKDKKNTKKISHPFSSAILEIRNSNRSLQSTQCQIQYALKTDTRKNGQQYWI